ncbi:MAG: hypothetical protein K9M99_05490 [Candidatus Cloacimonetes bacterium]|nr:hypothetical protein [Candidatus Cloacimonadota bacterium]
MNNLLKIALVCLIAILLFACEDNNSTLVLEPYFNLPEVFTFQEDEILVIDFENFTNLKDSGNPVITATGNDNIFLEIDDFNVSFTTYNDWFGSEILIFTLTGNFDRTTLRDTVTVIVEPDECANILISNLSDNPANLYIHAAGSSSHLQDFVPANDSKIISIEDGDAGLNIFGGHAIIDYRHVLYNEEVNLTSSTSADLSINTAASVEIDNPYGCLDIESYSQSADMWVNIDYGSPEIIPAWEDLTKFYDPEGITTTKFIEYNGYTLFADEITATVTEDSYTRLDIYPDAGCIWVYNNSNSFIITQVYISPSSQSTWGNNMLSSTIEPSEFYAWSVTPEMLWDLKVVDNYDDEFPVFNLNIQTDDVYIYDYTGFRAAKSLTADQDKIENAKNNQITITNPRCEANNIPINSTNYTKPLSIL